MKLDTPEISWHGRDPVYSVDVQTTEKRTRLATGGADNKIRIWYLTVGSDGKPWVEFASNLSRHTKAVNVVRFSSTQHILASAGDESVIYLWKLQENQVGSSFMDKDEEIENKENWTVLRMLRGHLEDVYDLCWSRDCNQLVSGSVDNSAIVWDVNKGEKLHLLKDHKNYVQGVAFDPQSQYVATFSCDRSCRIYSLQSKRCVNHLTRMPVHSTNSIGEPQTKQIRMFHDDDSLKSFFRRLSFSPDGELLIVPCGLFDNGDSTLNTTFIFSRTSLSKPVLHYPGPVKPTVAVRCCPTLFELRNKQPQVTGDTRNDEKIVKNGDNMENTCESKEDENMKEENDKSKDEVKKSKSKLFDLPYRMVFAVASEDSIILYDTEQTTPFSLISKIHYQQINDLAWSSDGRYLVVCSTDGYCTIVMFEQGELGVPYKRIEATQSLDKNTKCDDISSPTTNNNPPSVSVSVEVKKQESISQNGSTSEPRRIAVTHVASTTTSNSDTTRENQQPQKRRIPLTDIVSPPTVTSLGKAANNCDKPRRIQLSSVPSTSSAIATGISVPGTSNGSIPKAASPQPRRIQLASVPSTSSSLATAAGDSGPQPRRVQLASVPSTSSSLATASSVSSNNRLPAKAANNSENAQPRRIQLSAVASTVSSIATGSSLPSTVSSIATGSSLPAQVAEASNKQNGDDVKMNAIAKETNEKVHPDQQSSTESPRRVSLLKLSS